MNERWGKRVTEDIGLETEKEKQKSPWYQPLGKAGGQLL
ncbi:hypothetical protein LCGC14_2682530, partial [marine sediment metagenome]